MDLHHLRIFVSVYRLKSFTRAAERLNISQPTISEHIKNLEYELACKLFDRLGRTILATKEADVLFPKAIVLLEDVDRLQDAVASVGDRVKGKVAMGASTVPGTYIIPSRAVAFHKANPDVSFEIIMGDSREISNQVVNHELLLGVVGAVMDTDRLDAVPFVEDDLVLAASSQVTDKTSLKPADLYPLPFLLRGPGSGTRKTMETFLEQQDIAFRRLNVVVQLGSSAAIKEALKIGLGAAIISRVAIQEELERGDLHEITINGLEMKRNFYLITRKKRTLPTHYQEFYNYLKSVAMS